MKSFALVGINCAKMPYRMLKHELNMSDANIVLVGSISGVLNSKANSDSPIGDTFCSKFLMVKLLYIIGLLLQKIDASSELYILK
jgi:hypothetical protein